jgi:hypothetical protein
MTKNAAAAASTFASLTNVALALKLTASLIERPQNQPGLGVFCGFSGLGKSTALSVAANKYRAVYVACRSFDTKKSLLTSITHEMGIEPGRATVPELVAVIADELMKSGKPLFLDDAHYMVNRNLIELVKDLYESSGAPILLAAEERFPKQLKRWEQVDNRVLYWQLAEPCGLADAKKLAQLYAPKAAFGDDWLGQCCKSVRGITRRVCVNIENARREAEESGHRGEITLKWWADRAFYTGDAPTRRPL